MYVRQASTSLKTTTLRFFVVLDVHRSCFVPSHIFCAKKENKNVRLLFDFQLLISGTPHVMSVVMMRVRSISVNCMRLGWRVVRHLSGI